MSFDNHYPHRKDRRRDYRDSREFDRSCRAHGGCPYCESGRSLARKAERRNVPDDLDDDEVESSVAWGLAWLEAEGDDQE